MNVAVKIQKKLRHLEHTQGIKILLAVESGSRAWGFASKDSDYDVRFIYQRYPAWYLSVQRRRDVIEIPINDELDFSGWDLKKALYLTGKCNPVLMEWLRSPIIYIETPEAQMLRDVSKRFFHPRIAMYHYWHMAEGNYREYLKGEMVRLKKYLYVLRPLLACQWLKKHHSVPPMEMEALLADAENIPRDEIKQLVNQKKEGFELKEGPRIDVLNDFIDNQLNFFLEIAQTMPRLNIINDELDELFFRLVWEDYGKR